MKLGRYLKTIIIISLCSLFFVTAAWADSNYQKHMVAFTNTDVPLHTVVKHVVVIGGNVNIAGTVTDEVVVVDGDVTLRPTARVTDRVVVIGGDIITEDGARVGKGIFRLGGHLAGANGLITAAFLLSLLWFGKIAVSLAFILIPILLAWGWGKQVEELGEIIDQGIIKSILTGMLGFLAVLIVDAILVISIIGIPVALIGSILVLLATALGFSGLCLSVSRYVSLDLPLEGKGVLVSTLYGALLVVMAINMPLVGFFIFALSWAASLGGVIIKLFARYREKED